MIGALECLCESPNPFAGAGAHIAPLARRTAAAVGLADAATRHLVGIMHAVTLERRDAALAHAFFRREIKARGTRGTRFAFALADARVAGLVAATRTTTIRRADIITNQTVRITDHPWLRRRSTAIRGTLTDVRSLVAHKSPFAPIVLVRVKEEIVFAGELIRVSTRRVVYPIAIGDRARG